MNPINKETVEAGVDATEKLAKSYQKFPWPTFVVSNITVAVVFLLIGLNAGGSGKDKTDEELSKALDFQRELLANKFDLELKEKTKTITKENDSLHLTVDTLQTFVLEVAQQVNTMKKPTKNINNKTLKR